VLRRTRTAILDGAQRCIERDGVRRTTMGEVALEAGVAKATLYNHFHTKDEVLAALVQARAVALAATCVGLLDATGPAGHGRPPDLAAAVAGATQALSESRALRRVADEEPAVLARLAAPSEGPAWTALRSSVVQVLEAAAAPAGEEAVALVLRHLLSHLLWPAQEADAQRAAQLLERSLRAGDPAAAEREPSPGVQGDGSAAAPGGLATGVRDAVAAAVTADPGAEVAVSVPSGLGWPV